MCEHQQAVSKPYYTYEEAADAAGIGRSSIYNYLHDMGMKGTKFKRYRRKYLSAEQVEQLKEYVAHPWERPQGDVERDGHQPEGDVQS